MSFQLEPMTAHHIAAARTLWSETEGVELAEGDSPEEIAAYLARNPGISTVALDAAGRVIAAVLCGHDGRRGYVYHLGVAKHRRGEGIGRAAMRRSLECVRQAGIRRALLLVAADNDGGHRFWQRAGWEALTFARPMGRDL